MHLNRPSRAVVVALSLAGCLGGCGDDWTQVPDWPAPEQISQLRLAGSCLIVEGDVRCWVWNETDFDPVLAARDEPFPGPPLPSIPVGGEVVAITEMGQSRCVVLDVGGVKCWGYNIGHALGLLDPSAVIGDDPAEMGEALPFVELGGQARGVVSLFSPGHCAWLEDGRVKCWGSSSKGVLGQPDGAVLGDEPQELGEALPAVAMGAGVSVKLLASGGWHVCALTEDGRVKCWGANEEGQLGIGSKALQWGGVPEELGDALPYVDLGSVEPVVQVSVGAAHSCALFEDGRLKCWGAATERYENVSEWEYFDGGRLGLGDLNRRGKYPEEMGDALPYVDLGTRAKAVAISAGPRHTCALLDYGQLKCWGSNNYGALGLEENDDRGDEPGEMGNALPTVNLGTNRSVRAFDTFYEGTCALLDDDSVKCWGAAGNGAGSKAGTMGDALVPILTASDLR